MATFNTLRASYDHVRIVTRSTPTYPGGGAAPIFDFTDETAVMTRFDELVASGLGVVLGLETTEQENKAMFYRQINVDPITGELSARSDPDYTRFDGFYQAVGQAVSGKDPDSYMLELYAGEPGAFLRDTAPDAIADYFYSSIEPLLLSKAALADLIRSGNSPWSLTDQLIFASGIIQSICEHLTDVIRAEAPDAKIVWTGPGFSNLTGPPTYLYMHPENKGNTLMTAHQYGPRILTHNGQNSTPLKPFMWPDPAGDWEDQSTDLATDRFSMNNGIINLPWTNASLNSLYNDFKNWCIDHSVNGYIAEFGSIEECRAELANQTYIAASRSAIDTVELFGRCEWMG